MVDEGADVFRKRVQLLGIIGVLRSRDHIARYAGPCGSLENQAFYTLPYISQQLVATAEDP